MKLPIIDFLYQEQSAYIVTFVPEDEVSKSEIEVVEILEENDNWNSIALLLERMRSLLGQPTIERIVHNGGEDFEICFEGRQPIQLSFDDDKVSACLEDIAKIVQTAWRNKI